MAGEEYYAFQDYLLSREEEKMRGMETIWKKGKAEWNKRQGELEMSGFCAAGQCATIVGEIFGVMGLGPLVLVSQTAWNGFRLWRDSQGRHTLTNPPPIDNPYFVQENIKGASLITQNYLFTRNWKDLEGLTFIWAGAIPNLLVQFASLGTVGIPNVTGTLQHANAAYSTARHRTRFAANGKIAKNWAQDTNDNNNIPIEKWLSKIEDLKDRKFGLRATDTVRWAIPLPLPPTLTLWAASTAEKVRVRMKFAKAIKELAQELHWHAFKELRQAKNTDLYQTTFGSLPQRVQKNFKKPVPDPILTHFQSAESGEEFSYSNKSGPYGPASAIFYEIFTRRGFTRIYGAYDIDRLICEPAGWMALSDKLTMI